MSDELHLSKANPRVQEALANMSPAERKALAAAGQEMYGNLDKYTGEDTTPMDETVFVIEAQVRSGLHPSLLTDDEKTLMLEMKGANWVEPFGYTPSELQKFEYNSK